MAESRIKVIGQGEFVPREWLRKEVLWASLMTPYFIQMAGWLDGSQLAQHNGNVSRQEVYNVEDDAELLAKSFFNQGKNIAGMVSSAAMFETAYTPDEEDQQVDILEIQAKQVDLALGRTAVKAELSEDKVYEECAELARSVEIVIPENQKYLLLRASRIMSSLAAREAVDWLQRSVQDEENSLPVLEINDGGFPRSGGDRVDKLQPVFHGIIGSEEYRALSKA